MIGSNAESDKALLKMVSRRLDRTGTQSRLTATVQRGTVTLRGKLRFENQRIAIVKAIGGVSGVRSVVDQLEAPPKMRPSTDRHDGAGHEAAPIEEVEAGEAAELVDDVNDAPQDETEESEAAE